MSDDTNVADATIETNAAVDAPFDPYPKVPTEPQKPPRKIARFVESERQTEVPLKHAVECDGRIYDRVFAQRLNVSEIRAYFAIPQSERGRLPMVVDEHGETIPQEVLDALSYDDSTEVATAVEHFLPSLFRVEPEPSPSPSTGEVSPPS